MADAGSWPVRTVGREPHLARFDQVLAGVAGGEFHVVAIRGEPGIGKSVLLAELAARARDRDLTVFAGRATEFEQSVPFGVFIDAFEPALAGATERLDADSAAALAALAAAGHRVADRPAAFDRYRLFHGARQFLERQSDGGGMVLVLDDLHWADPSSLELTEYLLRRPPRIPLLIAAAHRVAQPPPGLADALARLDDAATVIALEPLSQDDMDELLPNASVRRRRLLHRVTRGNPLYLRVLADVDERTLTSLGGQPVDDAAVPEQALLGVLSAELTALEPELQRVVCTAAIAGDPADPHLVAWVAQASAAAVAEAFDRLCRAGVLVPAGPQFRFRHPLVRAAAYWLAGPAWRIEAHDRCARYLRDRHGPLPVLAHHVERCAQHGDEQAVATLVEAARAVWHTAPATAARMVRRAVQLLPDRPDVEARRGELLLLQAKALGLSGRLAESRRVLHDLLAAAGPARVETVAFAAMIDRLLGRFDEAKAVLTAELDDLPESGAATVRALVELSNVEILRHEPRDASRHAARAVAAAANSTDTVLLASAHAVSALSLLQSSQTGAANRHVTQAAHLVDASADAQLRTSLALVVPMTWVEVQVHRYDDAERHLRRAIDLATVNGLTYSMPCLRIVETLLHTRRGRLDEAIASAIEAREQALLMRAPEVLAMADVVRLQPTIWRHGPKAALELAGELSRGDRPSAGWWAALARVGLASVYLANSKYELCMALLTQDGADDASATYTWAFRGVATSALGRPHEGLHCADQALAHARRTGLSHLLGAAHNSRARILRRLERYAEAVSDADLAADCYRRVDDPVDEGRVRELLASIHARWGHHKEARAELGRAKALYSSTSASWLSAGLARHELRLAARKTRNRRTGTGGLATLTVREREIVDLATTGLTNREIADRLYLSAKTIEAHLSRAFAKLGVRSRVALMNLIGTGELR